MGRELERVFQSEGFTPDAWTRTRNSPEPGFESGISPKVSTSRAGPLRSYQIAFMAASRRSRSGARPGR